MEGGASENIMARQKQLKTLIDAKTKVSFGVSPKLNEKKWLASELIEIEPLFIQWINTKFKIQEDWKLFQLFILHRLPSFW